MEYTGKEDLNDLLDLIFNKEKDRHIIVKESRAILQRIHNEAYQDGYLKGVEINKEIKSWNKNK